MPKLLITADVHGSYGTWMALKSLLEPEDALVVAGDLFDTRYGHWNSPDFQPRHIRDDLGKIKNQVYYVQGNCDEPAFYPDQVNTLTFEFMGLKIFLHHGHRNPGPIPSGVNLVIQGHTHLAALENIENTFFLNPGSLSYPRNGLFTYGIVTDTRIQLMNLKTGMELTSLSLVEICHPR